MSWYFDFHNLSVTTDYPLAEYLKVRGDGPLGLHIWEPVQGNRTDALRFRHEHAHFASFMASGLADLYGVFSDYLLVLMYSAINRQLLRAPGVPLKVPMIGPLDDSQLPDDIRAAMLTAWNQITALRALLFGFGSTARLEQLVNWTDQDRFWESHFELRFARVVQRFHRLLKCLKGDAGPDVLGTFASPTVLTARGQRSLSARSVMEAYAIAIELMNVHFRGAWTSLTLTEQIARDPGELYTIAIEHLLAHAMGEAVSWQDFLSGSAPQTSYYTVAATAFASMQVPVLQGLDGEVTIGGGGAALSPAHRFCRLVTALKEGILAPIPERTRGDNKEGLIAWLRDCHRIVDDHDSMRMCQLALDEHERNAQLREKPAAEKSVIEMSWAARANFLDQPNEYVTDAGLFAEKYGCQVRFVRTGDAKIVLTGQDPKRGQALMWESNSPLILEAVVFGDAWDSIWAKFPEYERKDRAGIIQAAIAYAGWACGDHSNPRVPEIELRAANVG